MANGQEWYVLIGMERIGPFSSSELKSLAETGTIEIDTVVIDARSGQSAPAGKIKNLFKPKESPRTTTAEDQRAMIYLNSAPTPPAARPKEPPQQIKIERPQELLPSTAECPFCGEQIQPHARKCKHCNEYLDENLREEEKRLTRRRTKSPKIVINVAGGNALSSADNYNDIDNDIDATATAEASARSDRDNGCTGCIGIIVLLMIIGATMNSCAAIFSH